MSLGFVSVPFRPAADLLEYGERVTARGAPCAGAGSYDSHEC